VLTVAIAAFIVMVMKGPAYFEFQLIQTDPNLANYRYDCVSRRVILLDFGATRAYPSVVVDAYRRLLAGVIVDDRQAMGAAASAIGYFRADIRERQRQLVLDVFQHACEPLRHAGAYDFGNSNLPARMRDAGLAVTTVRDSWHTPPTDALFLHRKAGGLYLLAASLKARVDVGALFRPYVSPQAPS
jgi:hypothetical protein